MSRRRPAPLATAYAGRPRDVRLHTALRWATAPMDAVEAELPPSGDVLEVGCGHGLFSLHAALRSPARRVEGVDVDAGKVDDARAAAAALGLGPDRVAFDVVAPGWVPPGGRAWDAVVVVDVLYLLGAGEALALVGAAARAVAPGGRLLVKEMDTTRRFRAALSRAQELVSTRVTRVTEGETVELVDLAEVAAVARAEGLSVRRVDLSRGHHVPHALVVATRPG